VSCFNSAASAGRAGCSVQLTGAVAGRAGGILIDPAAHRDNGKGLYQNSAAVQPAPVVDEFAHDLHALSFKFVLGTAPGQFQVIKHVVGLQIGIGNVSFPLERKRLLPAAAPGQIKMVVNDNIKGLF